MTEKIPSHGKCLFCEKEFSKSSMATHLKKHLAEKAGKGKPGQSFLLKIGADPRWGSAPYFLNLWADGNTTLQKIDLLLRQIWLECCGHMSAFRFPQQKRGGAMNFMHAMAAGNIQLGEYGEIPMNKKAKDIFHKDLKLQYEYDFGSTTELQLTVVEKFDAAAPQPLVLLSRNERLIIPCPLCGQQPATQVCSVCEDENCFCDACAKKHAKKCPDFADYAAMRVVNSPRMGVCAYEGGDIDKGRD